MALSAVIPEVSNIFKLIALLKYPAPENDKISGSYHSPLLKKNFNFQLFFIVTIYIVYLDPLSFRTTINSQVIMLPKRYLLLNSVNREYYEMPQKCF